VAVDAAGNLYIADLEKVRKVATNGIITTIAGGGSLTGGATDGGPATSAFFLAYDVVLDGTGNFYIADMMNNRIRKVDMVTHGGKISSVISGMRIFRVRTPRLL